MQFKKRAPRAVKEIRAFATKAMVRYYLSPIGPINQHEYPQQPTTRMTTHDQPKEKAY